jgi:hypothetical protein
MRWSYAQIIFPASFAAQRVLNKDAAVWLDGARPSKQANLKFNKLII